MLNMASSSLDDLFLTDAVVDESVDSRRYSRKPTGTADQGYAGED